jgi:putative FmdB family regulatory protein
MPLYEYVCEEDGTKIELLRCMSEADDPVEDPLGQGRTFTRALSAFAAKVDSASGPAPAGGGPCCMGGGCGCSGH